MLPLLIRANQAAKRLGLDALAGARVVDALQGLTAEQRLNRVLARLRAREQYDREHELLSVVAEVALTHASNEGSVVPGGGRIDPPLAPILRYASATIGGLGLADDAAAQLSRVLVDASIELLGLNESERVDRLFARLREPAQYEHELDVIAAMTEAALVEQLERGGSAVRSSSGGTDPPLAPIIHRGARTIIGLQSDEAEIVRVTQALASLTREIAGMKRDDRLTHLNQLLLVRSRDEPVRELIAMLVFELEEG
jgi:hypothetical protein